MTIEITKTYTCDACSYVLRQTTDSYWVRPDGWGFLHYRAWGVFDTHCNKEFALCPQCYTKAVDLAQNKLLNLIATNNCPATRQSLGASDA